MIAGYWLEWGYDCLQAALRLAIPEQKPSKQPYAWSLHESDKRRKEETKHKWGLLSEKAFKLNQHKPGKRNESKNWWIKRVQKASKSEKVNESIHETRKSYQGGSVVPDSRDPEQSNKNKEIMKRTKNQWKKSNDYKNYSRM